MTENEYSSLCAFLDHPGMKYFERWLNERKGGYESSIRLVPRNREDEIERERNFGRLEEIETLLPDFHSHIKNNQPKQL